MRQDVSMTSPALYRLHLGKAILYRPLGAMSRPEAEIPAGHECIWVFAPEGLVINDPDFGPMVKRPLSTAMFAGRAPIEGAPNPLHDKAKMAVEAGPDPEFYELRPGNYLFMQWRKVDYKSIEEGLEEFVRQIWWEGEKAEGPWMLRVVGEDNDTAYQGLRRLAKA